MKRFSTAKRTATADAATASMGTTTWRWASLRMPAWPKWMLAMLMAAQAMVLAQAPPPPPPAVSQLPNQPPNRVFQRGGYLGVGIQQITAERARALKLREEGGLEVTSVIHESPAEKAGLKAGDVVVAYNGQKIESIVQFSGMVRDTAAGRDIKVDIIRDGMPQSVPVKIESRVIPRILTDGGRPNIPNMPPNIPDVTLPDIPRLFTGLHSPMLGIEAESLDGQLAEFFGVKDGVLVRAVLKNSAAEKAGLKAGDVILRLDDAKVTSAADISAKLRIAPGRTFQVSLMREHKETTLPVTPETPERAAH
jgi:serine protease Do